MRFQQVIQPGGPGSFLESDVYLSAQPIDKVQDHVRFGFDDTFHHDLPGSIPDRDRDAFLMHVHADIFTASHKRVLLSGMVCGKHQNLTPKKGHPFILRIADHTAITQWFRSTFGISLTERNRAIKWTGQVPKTAHIERLPESNSSHQLLESWIRS